MFRGQYNHTIDAKGRLIIPVKYREQLGDTFICTKGFDKCLYLYPLAEWQNVEDRFGEINSTSKKARKLARFFFGSSSECELDKQGRVLIPAALREFAGLEKDTVLLGVRNRIEVWDANNLMEEETDEDMDDIVEDMGELGFMI